MAADVVPERNRQCTAASPDCACQNEPPPGLISHFLICVIDSGERNAVPRHARVGYNARQPVRRKTPSDDLHAPGQLICTIAGRNGDRGQVEPVNVAGRADGGVCCPVRIDLAGRCLAGLHGLVAHPAGRFAAPGTGRLVLSGRLARQLGAGAFADGRRGAGAGTVSPWATKPQRVAGRVDTGCH